MRHFKSSITVAILIAAVVGLSACGQTTAQPTPTPSAAPTLTVTPATIGAPEPVAPGDESYFVDSDVTLKWDWPPGLGKDQTFAVHLWVDNQPPQEIWTGGQSLDVKQAIDGFNRDVGAYHWQVVVINASAQKGFIGTASEWSPIQTINRVRRITPTALPEAQLSDTARLMKSKRFTSTDELVDYARNFIYTYSKYAGKSEPGKPDRSDTLEKMYLFSLGKGPAPITECSARATAMLTLLAELGIDSRLIFLYADNGNSVGEHTELEVYNPDTQRWEITDPNYDVYFVNTANGERASIAQLVFGPLDSTRPCDTCDPQAAAKASSHFEAYRIGYTDTFYVNPDRFDVSHRFSSEKNHNLAEYLTGNASDYQFMFGPPPDS